MVGSAASSPFAITAAVNSVRLDAGQTAVTTFTVSNATARALNGRARLRPQSPEIAGWLTIAGDTDRLFAPNEAAQYSVNIAAPAQAPAGKFTFSLDVVGVDNPDELFTQGPPVTIEVAAVPVPEKKLPWWWWIPVATVGVLIVAVLAFVLLRPDDDAGEVSAERTLKSTAPVDLDSGSDVTAPSGADDLQYSIVGESHLIVAFQEARVTATSNGTSLTVEACRNTGDADVGLVVVPANQQPISLCVKTNKGATSLVVAQQVAASGSPVRPNLNPQAVTTLQSELARAAERIPAADRSRLNELLLDPGRITSPLPTKSRDVKIKYTTVSD